MRIQVEVLNRKNAQRRVECLWKEKNSSGVVQENVSDQSEALKMLEGYLSMSSIDRRDYKHKKPN